MVLIVVAFAIFHEVFWRFGASVPSPYCRCDIVGTVARRCLRAVCGSLRWILDFEGMRLAGVATVMEVRKRKKVKERKGKARSRFSEAQEFSCNQRCTTLTRG